VRLQPKRDTAILAVPTGRVPIPPGADSSRHAQARHAQARHAQDFRQESFSCYSLESGILNFELLLRGNFLLVEFRGGGVYLVPVSEGIRGIVRTCETGSSRF
jgi:hypothetical protein